MWRDKMKAIVIKSNRFALITLSNNNNSEIIKSWSDISDIIENVKRISDIDSNFWFYEVYPSKSEILNHANERHFFSGQFKEYFDLNYLEKIIDFTVQEIEL